MEVLRHPEAPGGLRKTGDRQGRHRGRQGSGVALRLQRMAGMAILRLKICDFDEVNLQNRGDNFKIMDSLRTLFLQHA